MEEIGNLKKLHEHPLILYQYGKPDGGGGEGRCSKCGEPWHPPAFSCSNSNCDFHIHQSCIDLPPTIRTPIHHHHKSPLALVLTNTYCKCCGQKPTGKTYSCPKCDFIMDLQCVIADTKATALRHMPSTGHFRYFAHPHPLTFLHHQHQHQHSGNRIVLCLVCHLRIHSASSSTYFCSHCDSHIHQQCAELSREIRDLRFHQHPLLLFARSFVKDNLCNSCRNDCFDFFYSCPPCKFNLHVACLSSFQHQHHFIQLQKKFPYTCQLCGKDSEPALPWFCTTCHLFAHKNCAELPTILHTYEHHHPLNLTFSLHRPNLNSHDICKICREKINMSFARYVCHDCGYDAHLNCAENRQKFEDEEQDMKSTMPTKVVEVGTNGILHFSHKHTLTLCPGREDHNKQCNGCMQCIITQSYGCQHCGFYLHEECATFPRRRRNTSLHRHELNMVYIPDFMFSCALCLQYCQGFAYHCKKCNYTVDVRCAAITFPFIHPSHNHPLFLYNDKWKHKCGGCGASVKNKLVFGCDDCNFYLDARCANLPLAVRNRFDEHPLSLTFVKKDDDEHYCDICEQERATNKWFYCCKMCCFAAHLSCALGDYPFLKSAKFEAHRHPLNLVKEGKRGYSACAACGHSCEGNLTFECGHCACKFNVHAFGLCYHRQLTQGRITFTMPSLYSRSLALYLDPIQRKRSESILLGRYDGQDNGNRQIIQYEENGKSVSSTKHGGDAASTSKEEGEDVEWNVAMSLGQYGGFEGRYWDDGAFSSILKVVITHEKSINSLRIQYDDNGTLTWSERHGGNRGVESTVNLEYPDEYLISIRGHVGFYGKHYVTRSLTFESNKKIYGPFGAEEGRRFWFPTSGAKIVGFHGRSSNYLDSIGIKVVPIHNNIKTTTSE